ncbi:MAG: glycosyltransferase [Patescibacteria group bacterium]
MKLSFILPTYNEAGNIGKLIETIKFQEELKAFTLEFIVVDDNSSDDTQNVVQKLIRKKWPVKLIVRRHERGLASAILTGIRQAKGDYLIIMDTDLTHRPEDIYRLLEPVQKEMADLVVGSRYIPGGGMHVSEANNLQYWLSKWGNFIVNRLIFNFPVHESLSGFLVVRRKILTSLNLNRIFYGYGEFCIRLIYYCHEKGLKIKEVPVMYGFRQYGVSKSNLFEMIVNYLITSLKLRFCGPV